MNLPENGRVGSAITGVFPNDLYETINKELRCLEWEEAQQHFYRQRERNLAKVPIFQSIFSDVRCAKIAENVGAFFGVTIDRNFDIAAHKMIDGDYIGVHTDENDFGETHRMTVTFNEQWQKENGGILLTLNSPKVSDIDGAWLPSKNNGYLFEICEHSHHAVTPVTSRIPRYSLIMTFKKSAISKTAKVWDHWYPFPLIEDIKEAAFTGNHMGISRETFYQPYSTEVFTNSRELEEYASGKLTNAPCGLSYSNGSSRNVDEFGNQPRGSDESRINKIAAFKRLPPICIVRRNGGELVLVNGSHRLSHATDTDKPICAIIFNEQHQ